MDKEYLLGFSVISVLPFDELEDLDVLVVEVSEEPGEFIRKLNL